MQGHATDNGLLVSLENLTMQGYASNNSFLVSLETLRNTAGTYRGEEPFESRGGRPGLLVPNSNTVIVCKVSASVKQNSRRSRHIYIYARQRLPCVTTKAYDTLHAQTTDKDFLVSHIIPDDTLQTRVTMNMLRVKTGWHTADTCYREWTIYSDQSPLAPVISITEEQYFAPSGKTIIYRPRLRLSEQRLLLLNEKLNAFG